MSRMSQGKPQSDAYTEAGRWPSFVHGTAIARSCLERGIQVPVAAEFRHWQRLVSSAQRIGNALTIGYGNQRHTRQWKEVY